MGRITYSGRGGEIRFYDNSGTAWAGGGAGSAGTPYFFKVRFENLDFTGPAAKPRPVDPIVVTVDGYVHAPQSEDYEAAFYEPLEFSFSCLINDLDRIKLRDSLCNLDLKDPWTVGGQRWTSTKGKGSIVMSDGTYQGTRAFSDTKKVTVDMQLLFQSAQATTSHGMNYEETYIPPQNVEMTESPDQIELSIRGLIYGDTEPIATFTTGVEV